jgi:hypothetical protein
MKKECAWRVFDEHNKTDIRFRWGAAVAPFPF